MNKSDIFSFEKINKVNIKKEKFCFAVIGLAHSHIYEMCLGLIKEGATLKYVYETDRLSVKNFSDCFPKCAVCENESEIYSDEEVKLIVCAAIPCDRADIAVKSMNAGKDFFVDKAPFINIEDLEKIKNAIKTTKRKYFVFYSESIDNESSIFARNLIKRGVIGNVFHIDGFSPHLLNPQKRPDWFFNREKTGGILIDLCCHQIHQFLTFTNSSVATIDYSRTRNYHNQKYNGFDDFGDLLLTNESGVSGYFRVDWSSPSGLMTWGDTRMFIEGSKGYIELRKNCNVCYDSSPNTVIVVTDDGQFIDNVTGKVEKNFFYNILFDCINRTETAISLELELKSIELAIIAQNYAMAYYDKS